MNIVVWYTPHMELPSTPPPARLFFILARNAPVGVIFRRGPSYWVQVVKWNTDNDTFEEGQWFHGRIYEKRCDLSPDGSLLIYLAQKINKKTIEDTEYTYAWTAISKPPYLTALTLWPKGDCWNGGGLFRSGNRVWLNHVEGAKAHKDHPAPKWMKVDAHIDYRGEDGTVFDERSDRDGWKCAQPWEGTFVQSGVKLDFAANASKIDAKEADWLRELHVATLSKGADNYGYVTYAPVVCEKVSPLGDQTLVMTTAFVGKDDKRKYLVRENTTGQQYSLSDAEWADWDFRGRVVFAREGKIFSANIDGKGVCEVELADLNSNKRVGVKAPLWASTWQCVLAKSS
jgi:hypothetical protein